MRLTTGMLDAMMLALNEMLAGEGPQGYDESTDEAGKIMRNADKAADWVAQENHKRKCKSALKRREVI